MGLPGELPGEALATDEGFGGEGEKEREKPVEPLDVAPGKKNVVEI